MAMDKPTISKHEGLDKTPQSGSRNQAQEDLVRSAVDHVMSMAFMTADQEAEDRVDEFMRARRYKTKYKNLTNQRTHIAKPECFDKTDQPKGANRCQ